MSEPPSDLSDIRQTGDDAERYLRLLDQADRISHVEMLSSEVGDSSASTSETGKSSSVDQEKSSAHPLLFVLLGAVLLVSLCVLFWSGSRSFSSFAPQSSLRWQASCGSRASTTGRWWPVLGPSSRSVLNRVKNNYCGDAYLNAGGVVQVASFDTREAAVRFSDRLSAVTGVRFRVGRSK